MDCASVASHRVAPKGGKAMKQYLRFVYRIWAPIYDKYIDRVFHFYRDEVIRALKLKRNECVLEIGVGTGLNLPHYPSRVFVAGIDFSRAMLTRARRKRTKAKVKLYIMDATRTKFKSNTFDKALTTYVLRVAPDPKAILFEVARVTKPGARFVVLDQFKESKSLLFSLFEPMQLALGWGRNYHLAELLKGTPWKIRSRKHFGRMRGTLLAVLENCKST